MSQPIRLGLIVVASPPEVGAGDAPALLARLGTTLRADDQPPIEITGCMVVTTPDAAVAAGRAFYDQRVDAVVAIAASWFEDYLVLDLLEECLAPVVAWARPGMATGSLCGMQQLCFMLKQLGRPYLFLFDEPDGQEAAGRAREFAAAAGLARQLRRARIGHLGHRVEGMTETTAHELALKRTFGPRVVGIDTQVFLERARRIDIMSLATDWQALTGQVGRVTATDDAGIGSLQVAQALRATVAELGLASQVEFAELLPQVQALLEPGGYWRFVDLMPPAMPAHWIFTYFPDAWVCVRDTLWTSYKLSTVLREAGFGVKLKERSFYQPVSLAAAHAIAQQRPGLLATLSDDVYQKGVERLAEESHARGAATLIGSEFTLVEILAVKGEQPKPKRRRPSFRKAGEEATEVADE